MICACWHMLSTGEISNDLGGDYYYARRDPERATKRLVAQLERLGRAVILQEAAQNSTSAVFSPSRLRRARLRRAAFLR